MKIKKLKNNKGQSVVEYVLMLLVAVTLSATIFNSTYFQEIFQGENNVFVGFKNMMEYSYRHARSGKTMDNPNYSSTYKHPSYFNSSSGTTRFFGPVTSYP